MTMAADGASIGFGLLGGLVGWLEPIVGPLGSALESIGALTLSREAWLVVAAQFALLLLAAFFLSRRRRGTLAALFGTASRTGRAVDDDPRSRTEPPSNVTGYMTAGLAVALALVGGVGGWAATSHISGAVIAAATVVVESNIKKVQHPTGGIAGRLLVREGDTVGAGDLLIQLDATQTRASLQIVVKQLVEIWARQARLAAERDGASGADLASALRRRLAAEAAMVGVSVNDLVAAETRLFEARLTAREGQKAQLRERSAQLGEEIAGVTAQRAAKDRESELIAIELTGIETLEEQRLVTTSRVTALRREAARIGGERGQLQATIAQARGRIAEIRLQTLQIDTDLQAEISKELRDLQSKEAELVERRIAADDQLARVDIRAPMSGTVHQLTVHTVGGVIAAGEPILLIVPGADKLVIEARIAPHDIDQVRNRKDALVRFPAFNQRTTPEIRARLQRVSADLMREPQSNQTYYLARLEPAPEDLPRLGDQQLTPGMPAEVYIRTDARTVLSYLVKPFEDQFARTFRER